MQITGVNKNFDVEVDLVGSKSESNRVLMIGYYGGFTPRVKNLSTSDDTKLLNEILLTLNNPKNPKNPKDPKAPTILNCANAGTVLRFLATALAFREGEWILTGSDRMLQRPVGDLVDALRTMGANIEYVGEQGFPPLMIHGKNHVETFPETSPIHVDITNSSQFGSSILLAKPSHIHLDGDLSSLPYIDMTIDIMCHFSAHVKRDGRDIFVQPSDYQDVEYTVESDWTCASYWYEMVAFSENGRARLHNLHLGSKQGDAIVAKWFEQFGVKSIQDDDDVVIVRTDRVCPRLNDCDNAYTFDFINNPDLYPTIAATCAGLGVEGDFKGLRNLKLKESDRVAAMTTELAKINKFDSHNDHRIAMALAPLAMKIGAIEIDNADVVSKSYPNFWQEFKKITPNR